MPFSRLVSYACPSRTNGIYQAQYAVLACIGIITTFGFSLLNIPFARLAHSLEGIFLLLFIAALFRAPAAARRDTAWFFFYGSIALAVLTYTTSHLQFPRYAEPYPQIDVLGGLFLFFPIAWWLGGNTKKVLVLFALALVGLFLGMLHYSPWSDVTNALHGQRVGFGLRNPEHTGVFFGTALIGWLAFLNRLTRAADGRIVPWRMLLWALMFVLLSAGKIVTQTRAVWLGLITSAILLAAVAIFRGRHLRPGRTFGATAVIIVLLGASIVYSGAGRIITARVDTEQNVINQLLAGKTHNIPYTSIGLRIKLWQEAWRWIKQRPITGWGYRAKKSVIDDSPRFPEWIKKDFGHLHNSLIGLWVTFGLLGVALLAWLAWWIGICSWRAWRAGRMPSDVFLFGVAFFPFWIVVNQFESYFIWGTGTYLMGIIGGGLYTYHLAGKQAVRNTAAADNNILSPT